MPIVNRLGVGPCDGTRRAPMDAAERAYRRDYPLDRSQECERRVSRGLVLARGDRGAPLIRRHVFLADGVRSRSAVVGNCELGDANSRVVDVEGITGSDARRGMR